MTIIQTQLQFRRRVEEIGFDQAYREIEKTYVRNPFLGHSMDHYAGDYLYELHGIDGIEHCVNTFTSGCAHQIINKVFAVRGISAVEDITKKCDALRAPSRCRHGLGHALLEYLGRQRLETVLDICSRIDENIKPSGCIGGALMEHFFPSVNKISTLKQVKPYNAGKPYDQCLYLSQKYQVPCIYALIEWWDEVFHHKYRHVYPLCAQLADTHLRNICYAATGSVMTYTMKYSRSMSVRLCKQIPDASGVLWCRAGIEWFMRANNKIGSDVSSDELCGAKSTQNRTACDEAMQTLRNEL